VSVSCVGNPHIYSSLIPSINKTFWTINFAASTTFKKWANSISWWSWNVEGFTASKHCAVLRLVGFYISKRKKMHYFSHWINDLRNIENVSTRLFTQAKTSNVTVC